MSRDLRNIVDGIAERVVLEDLASTSYGAESLARYLFAAQWAPGRRVVDLCCGIGYGTSLMLAAGATSAAGIDVSPDAIAEAQRRFARPGVEFSVDDVSAHIDIDDAQLRVCFEGLEHVSDADGLLDNLRRRLSPEGVAIVSTPNGALHPSGHSGNPHHEREYALTEFEALLHARFGHVRMFFQWRYPDPHDVDWTFARAVRAVIPVRVKHAVRRRTGSPAGHSSAFADAGPISALDYRPLPASYLRLPPGLRFGEPSIWIAVCRTGK